MGKKADMLSYGFDRLSNDSKGLVGQILWLIRLRWIAAMGMVAAAFVCSFIFPVLASAVPIYICAAILLLCNVFYYYAATRNAFDPSRKYIVLGIIQEEADLFILTALLYFSGGVANPFCLFYIFHVIIAAIILPRYLSLMVSLTAILLFGLLAINELSAGAWLAVHPLQLSVTERLWDAPVYMLGVFVAFVFTVVLARYLTRIIVIEMKAQQHQTSRNNDLLNGIISAMAEGLVFVTGDGKVAICNPAAELWKKTGKADNNDDPLESFPSVLTGYINGLLAGDNNDDGKEGEIEFNTDGPDHRYIEAKSCPVRDVNGQRLGHVVVGQDLTRHKKLEKDLRSQTERVTAINEMLKMTQIGMAQREKMVAIGQMAAGIAHEIGNPLASLSSVVQYLGRKMGGHEEKENLLVIEHQIDRISNILKRMLSLSRPATGEYKWTDINEVIDGTLNLIKLDKRMQSVTVRDTKSDDLPTVWLNPQLFEQVLLNIFINALDAIDASRSQQEHSIEVISGFKDDIIDIRITDTGVGMSPKVARRAFESFFTTKDIGKGTGLGLFISNNLIKEIDGTIEIESELDKGATVIIRIPVRPKEGVIGGDNRQRGSSERCSN